MLKSKTAKLVAAVVCVTAIAGVAVTANAVSHSWRGGMMLRHMDANGDGQVTREEVMPKLVRKFDRVDANADGKVTQDEVSEHIRQRVERRVGHMFARFDANGDGIMTKPELEAHVDAHFKRVDTNKDGIVSQEEAGAFRDALRDHMRKFFTQGE
ncbi:MAG: EF-hand domain-containing protein [Pseudomonadota bacterium]